MKQTHWFNLARLAGSVAAVLTCGHVQAMLTGLDMLQEPAPSGPPPAGGPRTVFRVYAHFSNPTDHLLAWGCGSGFGPGSIQNITVFGNPGLGFTNVGGGSGQLAPYSPGTPRDWDSYMTIGVAYGNEAPGGLDATAQIPGTPLFIPDGATEWMPDQINGGGVYVIPDNPQGRGDYRVVGNDTANRVLLMQLVVNAGEYARGTIGVAWGPDGQPGQTVAGLTFDFLLPAPGGLPLLACAGLLGSSRRRRS